MAVKSIGPRACVCRRAPKNKVRVHFLRRQLWLLRSGHIVTAIGTLFPHLPPLELPLKAQLRFTVDPFTASNVPSPIPSDPGFNQMENTGKERYPIVLPLSPIIAFIIRLLYDNMLAAGWLVGWLLLCCCCCSHINSRNQVRVRAAVVTGQAPVTLEWKNIPGKTKS